jgi:hypothetical protein
MLHCTKPFAIVCWPNNFPPPWLFGYFVARQPACHFFVSTVNGFVIAVGFFYTFSLLLPMLYAKYQKLQEKIKPA